MFTRRYLKNKKIKIINYFGKQEKIVWFLVAQLSCHVWEMRSQFNELWLSHCKSQRMGIWAFFNDCTRNNQKSRLDGDLEMGTSSSTHGVVLQKTPVFVQGHTGKKWKLNQMGWGMGHWKDARGEECGFDPLGLCVMSFDQHNGLLRVRISTDKITQWF